MVLRARLEGARPRRGGVVVVRAPEGARETAREAFRFLSVLPRAPRVINRDDFQKKFGFRPKGTANLEVGCWRLEFGKWRVVSF